MAQDTEELSPRVRKALVDARISLRMWSAGTDQIDAILGPMPEDERARARAARGGPLYDDPGVTFGSGSCSASNQP